MCSAIAGVMPACRRKDLLRMYVKERGEAVAFVIQQAHDAAKHNQRQFHDARDTHHLHEFVNQRREVKGERLVHRGGLVDNEPRPREKGPVGKHPRRGAVLADPHGAAASFEVGDDPLAACVFDTWMAPKKRSVREAE